MQNVVETSENVELSHLNNDQVREIQKKNETTETQRDTEVVITT